MTISYENMAANTPVAPHGITVGDIHRFIMTYFYPSDICPIENECFVSLFNGWLELEGLDQYCDDSRLRHNDTFFVFSSLFPHVMQLSDWGSSIRGLRPQGIDLIAADFYEPHRESRKEIERRQRVAWGMYQLFPMSPFGNEWSRKYRNDPLFSDAAWVKAMRRQRS